MKLVNLIHFHPTETLSRHSGKRSATGIQTPVIPVSEWNERIRNQTPSDSGFPSVTGVTVLSRHSGKRSATGIQTPVIPVSEWNERIRNQTPSDSGFPSVTGVTMVDSGQAGVTLMTNELTYLFGALRRPRAIRN